MKKMSYLPHDFFKVNHGSELETLAGNKTEKFKDDYESFCNISSIYELNLADKINYIGGYDNKFIRCALYDLILHKLVYNENKKISDLITFYKDNNYRGNLDWVSSTDAAVLSSTSADEMPMSNNYPTIVEDLSDTEASLPSLTTDSEVEYVGSNIADNSIINPTTTTYHDFSINLGKENIHILQETRNFKLTGFDVVDTCIVTDEVPETRYESNKYFITIYDRDDGTSIKLKLNKFQFEMMMGLDDLILTQEQAEVIKNTFQSTIDYDVANNLVRIKEMLQNLETRINMAQSSYCSELSSFIQCGCSNRRRRNINSNWR